MSPSPEAAHHLRGFLGHMALITRMVFFFLLFNNFLQVSKILMKVRSVLLIWYKNK